MSNTQTIKTDDILAAIRTYQEGNERPCPKTFLSDKFGKGVLDMLDSLKKSGIIEGKRGRSGGFVVRNAAPTTVQTPLIEVTPILVDAPSDASADFQRVTNMLAGNEPMDVAFLRSVDPSLAEGIDDNAANL